jgi:molybdopterin/thiamine biosynthesis adenylyltransferase
MIEELSDTELETYGRQIALADIDYDGQVKLRNAKACIIGLGGLGSLIAPKLVGMGIGYLRLVDRDVVSRSDLHRQTLYDVDSIGKPKVEVALRKLSRLNPDVKLDPFPESLNSMNARELISGVDVILDGLDRIEPRYVVNRTCNELNIPYVFGAAIEAFGNLSTIVPGKTICLECFMSGLKDDDLPKCGVVGVHPSVLGVVTAVQVSEAVKLVIGREPKLMNKLLYIDLRELEFNIFKMNRREDCSVCGDKARRLPEPLADKFFEETCARDGRRNFVISPQERIEIDLEKLVQILAKRKFRIKTSDTLGVTFEASEDFSTSILKSGTMIAQASPKFRGDPKRDVLDTYKSILINDLGFSPAILQEP